MMIIDRELEAQFPGLGVLELTLNGLAIKETDERLNIFKHKVEDKIRSSGVSLDNLKDVRIIRAYRDFYWRVGIDPTKIRPAGEALARRVISGKPLPTINTFVDAYNLASAETFVAIAAFDLERVDRDALRMRRGKSGELFLGIGMEKEAGLSGIEIVIEDESSHKLVAIYPYRDSEDSKVTTKSEDILLIMCAVPGIEGDDLNRAGSLAKEYVETFCR